MNEIFKKITLSIFIFFIFYIILKNISIINKNIEGYTLRINEKIKKIFKRKPRAQEAATRKAVLASPLSCRIHPRDKNKRNNPYPSQWTSIDEMNRIYDPLLITKNNLYDKFDYNNNIIPNYRGNDLNIDNIYSFDKDAEINKKINENNILYAYWGSDGSNNILKHDIFNKYGKYDCYQDVTEFLKTEIKKTRRMAHMKNRFNDPLHGIGKKLFIKLKHDTQKYINDLKSLKSDIDNIVNSFDNNIKIILSPPKFDFLKLKTYKKEFYNIIDAYKDKKNEIKRKFSSMEAFDILNIENYVRNELIKRINIVNKLIRDERKLTEFYNIVDNKKRLQNLKISNNDFIFEGKLQLKDSNIINTLSFFLRPDYPSYKELFIRIFVCEKFDYKNIENINSKVIKINEQIFFNGKNYGLGLIDDNITNRINVQDLAVLKKKNKSR